MSFTAKQAMSMVPEFSWVLLGFGSFLWNKLRNCGTKHRKNNRNCWKKCQFTFCKPVFPRKKSNLGWNPRLWPPALATSVHTPSSSPLRHPWLALRFKRRFKLQVLVNRIKRLPTHPWPWKDWGIELANESEKNVEIFKSKFFSWVAANWKYFYLFIFIFWLN